MSNYFKDNHLAIVGILISIYVYLVPPAPPDSSLMPSPVPALIYASR